MVTAMLGATAWIGTLNLRQTSPSTKKQTEKTVKHRTTDTKLPIRSSRLKKTDYQVVIDAKGTLKFPVVPIHAEVAGRIKSTAQDFTLGSKVQPGQPLWMLDDQEFLDALTKTEATIQQILTEKELQHVNLRSLKNAVSIAQANLDRAQAKLDLENTLNRKAQSDLETDLRESNTKTDVRQDIVSERLNELKQDLSEATYSHEEATRVLKRARNKSEVEPLVIKLIAEDAAEAESRMTTAKNQIREMELKLRLPQIHLAKQEVGTSKAQLEKAMSDLAELPLAHENELSARLEAARIDQKKARVNLNRVVITAPSFPGVVSRITVKEGGRVVPGTLMAEIQTADHAHAVLSIPRNSLNYIKAENASGKREPLLPDAWIICAANTDLEHQWSAQFNGKIDWRTDANNPETSTTATLRVNQPYQKIENGLNLDGLPVESRIEGATLRNVFVLPQTATRNGNEILLCLGTNEMRWQRIDVIWSDNIHVVTRGTWNGQPALKEGAFYCLEPQSIETVLLPDGYTFKEVAD